MDFELIKAKKLYAQGKTAKEIASALKNHQALSIVGLKITRKNLKRLGNQQE